MKSNEEQLINLIKSGKQDIFTDLAYPYYNQAFSIAYNILKQYQDAEDATQNSYIKAFKSIYTFNGQSPFKHWLFRIVKNQAIDTYRSNQKLGNKKDAFRTIITVDSLLIGQTSNVKIQYSKNEISFVVNKLSPTYRDVIKLRFLESFSYEEISVKLMCSIGTVKSRISRGKKQIKMLMETINV